jgi:hypothetical protein
VEGPIAKPVPIVNIARIAAKMAVLVVFVNRPSHFP